MPPNLRVRARREMERAFKEQQRGCGPGLTSTFSVTRLPGSAKGPSKIAPNTLPRRLETAVLAAMGGQQSGFQREGRGQPTPRRTRKDKQLARNSKPALCERAAVRMFGILH